MNSTNRNDKVREYLALLEGADLTNEQKELITVYWRKWQLLAISTEPVNQEQTTELIKILYKNANLEEPRVIFVPSPDRYYVRAFLNKAQGFLKSVPNNRKDQFESILKNDPHNMFLKGNPKNVTWDLLRQQFFLPIERLLSVYLRLTLEKIRQGKVLKEAQKEAFKEIYPTNSDQTFRIIKQVDIQFEKQCGTTSFRDRLPYQAELHIRQNSSWMGNIYDSLISKLWKHEITKELTINMLGGGYDLEDFMGFNVGCIDRVSLAYVCARLDYFKNVLNFSEISEETILRSLVCCGGSMFFPYEKICIVCDSPRILSFDNETEIDFSKPKLIQFSDGFTIYEIKRAFNQS
jgi:hypothetical protein